MAILTQKQFGQRIQELREESNLLQEELAKCLDITRQAVGQIENGKRKVDSLELAKLAEFFSLPADALLKPAVADAKEDRRQAKMHSFPFHSNKLRNLLLYLLEKCGGKPNIGETVIYKLLYFIDFDAYELLDKPITGMSYIRLQFGPVPRRTEYMAVVNDMVESGELKLFFHQYFGKLQKRYVALAEPVLDAFTAKEIEVVDKVLMHLSDMNATEIETYVHLDAPWVQAAEGETIGYETVFEREFPYAKRDYGKAWEGAAAKDALEQLGPISKEEAEYYENL
ncbi:MAG: type II toxin-antitoxin system antitoxin SocA domain-containing protein [Pseudomonadota bacterium]